MKIIGSTKGYGFIVEMSQGEIETIGRVKNPNVGDVVDVDASWKDVQALAGYSPESGDLARRLRDLADKLTPPGRLAKPSEDA